MNCNFGVVREYRSCNVEIYQVIKYDDCDSVVYFMIYDTHRPSSIDDYPYLKGIELEYDETDNFIKCYVVSKKEIDYEESEWLRAVIENLIFHTTCNSCSYNYETIVLSKRKYDKFRRDRNYMIGYFDDLLKKDNYKYKIGPVCADDYNHLLQNESIR